MKFSKLNQNYLRGLAFADASHNNCDSSHSQLEYIILTSDNSNKFAIYHYKSYKSQRVAGCRMCKQTLSFIDAFDAAFLIRCDPKRILESKVQLQMLTKSAQVFNVLTKSWYTTEKLLMVDNAAAREAYFDQSIPYIPFFI